MDKNPKKRIKESGSSYRKKRAKRKNEDYTLRMILQFGYTFNRIRATGIHSIRENYRKVCKCQSATGYF